MSKIFRNYILEVQGSDGSITTIKPPFSLEFTIIRNTLSSSNIATVRIFNLSERTRSLLRKDQNDWTSLRTVTLKAGYGDNLPVIMAGNVNRCFSVREGVNVITQIESFDGGFAFTTAIERLQKRKGTSYNEIIDELVKSLEKYGISRGVIAPIEGTIGRGISIVDNPINILNQITGNSAYVDNGKIYILGTNDVVSSGAKKITSATGLLNTPRREESFIVFDMLFEPDLFIGQKITLESSTAATYNDNYKLVSLTHRGLISESVAGSATSSVGLSFGSRGLNDIGIF